MPDPSLEKIWKSQSNLERILDNLKEGIIAHDLDRRVFFFNREAEQITGYSRDDVLGRDCHAAFGTPFCGERCAFCNDRPTLSEHAEYAINIITKGGETRRLEMSVSTIEDERGDVFGVLTSFRDVTDLLSCQLRAKELTSFANIIGQDRKILNIFQQIRDLAVYDFPVHISGETGTGKELVATAIHNESRRGGAPFVPINCGALPEGLIESELFGHVKGAFSGAIRDKKGRFELADGGTVFLDEISELSKPMQVKLLRFLQEGTLEKVGDEQTRSVNVRIISATNTDLKTEVQRNRFREDLFYRLNVVPIHLPPLRERKTDIPLLAGHFLRLDADRHGRNHFQLSKAALSLMMDYHWPGNVRELQNAVQFSIVKCKGRVIRSEHLPMELHHPARRGVQRGPSRKLDVASVREAIRKTGGNKAKAAKLLGVGRATLYRFITAYPDVTKGLPF
ncbi:sigma-54-dependent transcriptional regulator [Olavius algarvensis associated proteobacterium Delta 3]|nr:sigma-54-dependent transcriptional regulator [Olavius algarvensis associated proteobacterium Delta 3]